ncbi:DUF4062 domain-containing protein [Pseudomonas sp. BIGb0427]|uniref:DUF4062 domain-containing protein n=1 Tax=Pseudomonas sp. BIGb0427 TaxID=2724470 RepID=UPI0018A7664C|nr:DUF4062 domain-containing protein [Pseudomonas sp. BIGb0427]QPG61254.1 DUF4062 domain-containing protein [Pseudomonas sp. BIGb0427]
MKRKLQIFVSSTFTDLIPERQAAVSAILKAGHIPAGMELFTAGDKSQMDTIKKWIDESDVYMLILGGRYGSVEPTSGMSYTELEYNYAIEQEKPFFAVVITDLALEVKIQKNGTAFFEKENPQALKLFREKVLSNISSFFEDEKDIRLSVHESLSDFASSRELKGWVQADEVIDTKPLFEEIKKLSEENQQLKMTLAEQEKKYTSRGTQVKEDVWEVSKILKSIDIKIPAQLNDGAETSASLFSLFVSNRDKFIHGITNIASASETQTFLYFNICPKLQVHGLVENEKVTGVRYRRYAITKAGAAFLAEYDRRVFEMNEKKKLNGANDSITKTAETSTTTQEPTAPKKTRKPRANKTSN